jgi:hypothetical protein
MNLRAAASCVILVGAGACSSAEAEQVPRPTSWPSAQLRGAGTDSSPRTCIVNAPEPTTTSRGRLPDDPSGADLLWYPGLNAGTSPWAAKTCRTFHTRLDAAGARALVRDLKSLPARPTGVYPCPLDDGSFVQAWFWSGAGAVSFRVGLAGCAFDLPSRLGDLGSWPAGMPSRG